jgi:S-adenosylmethionine:tRNA ribosyltransferase-isomerase
MSFLLRDYDYPLPEERIARYPPEKREDARLLVVHRSEARFEDGRFPGVTEHLRPGDALVINDTKVFRARLLGRRESGGKVEAFLLSERGPGLWRCLTFSGRPLKPGVRLVFGGGPATGLHARVDSVEEDGCRILRFDVPLGLPMRDVLRHIGHVPIPPYLRREDEPLDAERYQTVYASEEGSVAAPTAGLHFTPSILDELGKKGVLILRLTLHVGRGTFAPVMEEDLRKHRMEGEAYRIPPETIEGIAETRKRGGRVAAAGTTALRALETFARSGKAEGVTELFVHPPFEFLLVDALLTNFHLPKSTLLALVCAFAAPGEAEKGRELTLAAYRHAAGAGYRFYSYGDASLYL